MPKKLVAPTDFELVGGYRFPHTNECAFTCGSIAVDARDASRRLWMESHHNKALQYTLPELGVGADWQSWPRISKTGEYASTALGINATIEGLLYDPVGERLYVSSRSRYFSPPTDPSCWLTSVDFPSGSVNKYAVQNPTTRAIMNRFGGGMCLVPLEHQAPLGGKRLAFSSGGYRSGQASTCGPTLAPFAVDGLSVSYEELLRFSYFGAKDRATSEYRTPNYDNAGLSWYPKPEGDIGYWQADSVYGGAAWIEHPEYRGVCFQSLQGTGDLLYSRQNETFAAVNQHAFYVYDPDALLADRTTVHRGQYSLWDSQGIPGTPRGMAWAGGLLWVLYAKAYKSGVEKYPLIAAYRLKPLESDMTREEIDRLKAELDAALTQAAKAQAEIERLTQANELLEASFLSLNTRVTALDKFRSDVEALAVAAK